MKKALKYEIYVLIIFLAAILPEFLIYNFHPLIARDSYDVTYEIDGINQTEDIRKLTYNGNELVVSMKNPNQYVRKLYLTFDSPDSFVDYTVKIGYKSIFGGDQAKEEVEDGYYPELGPSSTNVNGRLRSFKIVCQDPEESTDGTILPTGEENLAKLTSIRLVTARELNPTRMIFCALVAFLIIFFIQGKNLFAKKPEWVMAMLCLLMGTFMITAQGISEDGWDESIHFYNAYNGSYSGDMIDTSPTYERMKLRLPSTYYTTREEKIAVTRLLNENFSYGNKVPREVPFSYKEVAYIPQSIAIAISRALGFSFSTMYMLGRFANLLLYTILMFAAAKAAPKRKEVFIALALIPTALFAACSYTYDVAVNGFFALAFALWLRAMVGDAKRSTIYCVIGSIACFILGALSKAVYIPVILICFLVPRWKYKSKRQYYIFVIWLMIVAACAILLASFMIPAIVNTLNNNSGWGSDPRGGATDMVAQLQGIFHYAPQYTVLLVKSIVKSLGSFLFGAEGLIKFGRFNELDSVYLYLASCWMFLVLFVQRKGEKYLPSIKSKLAVAAAVFAAMCLVWTCMYLAYTPVGRDVIGGVQARYYIPLLTPIAFLCCNKWLQIDMDDVNYYRLLMAPPMILLLLGIYNNILTVQYF